MKYKKGSSVLCIRSIYFCGDAIIKAGEKYIIDNVYIFRTHKKFNISGITFSEEELNFNFGTIKKSRKEKLQQLYGKTLLESE